jgi:hypothetical protein
MLLSLDVTISVRYISFSSGSLSHPSVPAHTSTHITPTDRAPSMRRSTCWASPPSPIRRSVTRSWAVCRTNCERRSRSRSSWCVSLSHISHTCHEMMDDGVVDVFVHVGHRRDISDQREQRVTIFAASAFVSPPLIHRLFPPSV